MEAKDVYELSMKLGEGVWGLVVKWSYFERDTIGKQLVRSADSVSANLAEGLGRYAYRDRNLFYVYSRGSLFETRCWIEKAKARNLIPEPHYQSFVKLYDQLKFHINRLISTTRLQSTLPSPHPLQSRPPFAALAPPFASAARPYHPSSFYRHPSRFSSSLHIPVF